MSIDRLAEQLAVIFDSFASNSVRRMNWHRKARGMKPLMLDDKLCTLAQCIVQEMKTNPTNNNNNKNSGNHTSTLKIVLPCGISSDAIQHYVRCGYDSANPIAIIDHIVQDQKCTYNAHAIPNKHHPTPSSYDVTDVETSKHEDHHASSDCEKISFVLDEATRIVGVAISRGCGDQDCCVAFTFSSVKLPSCPAVDLELRRGEGSSSQPCNHSLEQALSTLRVRCNSIPVDFKKEQSPEASIHVLNKEHVRNSSTPNINNINNYDDSSGPASSHALDQPSSDHPNVPDPSRPRSMTTTAFELTPKPGGKYEIFPIQELLSPVRFSGLCGQDRYNFHPNNGRRSVAARNIRQPPNTRQTWQFNRHIVSELIKTPIDPQQLQDNPDSFFSEACRAAHVVMQQGGSSRKDQPVLFNCDSTETDHIAIISHVRTTSVIMTFESKPPSITSTVEEKHRNPDGSYGCDGGEDHKGEIEGDCVDACIEDSKEDALEDDTGDSQNDYLEDEIADDTNDSTDDSMEEDMNEDTDDDMDDDIQDDTSDDMANDMDDNTNDYVQDEENSSADGEFQDSSEIEANVADEEQNEVEARFGIYNLKDEQLLSAICSEDTPSHVVTSSTLYIGGDDPARGSLINNDGGDEEMENEQPPNSLFKDILDERRSEPQGPDDVPTDDCEDEEDIPRKMIENKPLTKT